jgi:hypothetical protein
LRPRLRFYRNPTAERNAVAAAVKALRADVVKDQSA